MARCFEESHTAYARGEGARAKELSNEGKTHQREMERLNAQASEWIFVGAYAVTNVPSSPARAFALTTLHVLYMDFVQKITRSGIPHFLPQSLYFPGDRSRIASPERWTCTVCMSRKPSHTQTEQYKKRDRREIPSYISSSVRIFPTNLNA